MAKRRNITKSKRHAAKTALLIVGEGPDDQAFIKYMNQVFSKEGSDIRATIQKESGGSPGNIITNAIRKNKAVEFDQRFIVLDSDIAVEPAAQKRAKEKGYTLIFWRPQCLEGALLTVLGENVTQIETSQQLKQRLQSKLSGHHTESDAYSNLFTKDILTTTDNKSIKYLRDILIGK